MAWECPLLFGDAGNIIAVEIDVRTNPEIPLKNMLMDGQPQCQNA